MRNSFRALALAAGLTASQASFAALEFDLNFEFSGAADPSGSVLATFEQVASNTVRLTVDLTDLSGSEFVSGFYFNYNPTGSVALGSLGFAPGSGSGFTLSANSCTGGMGCNTQKADGDGFYDIVFQFPTSAGARFEAGETFSWLISGSGLTESNFNWESEGSSGNGSFFAAAHVQGIGANGSLSGWVGAVPEPETYALMLAGLGLLGFVARRRRKQS